MIHNDELLRQLEEARRDSNAEDRMIEQYMPFIKSEAYKLSSKLSFLESDDADSLSMFAFHNAITTYNEDKGAFFPYAAKLIHNQLLDYARKESRHQSSISLDSESDSDDDDRALVDSISSGKDSISELTDIEAAQSEINHFADTLKAYSLTLSDVAESCPKQDRTLHSCILALEAAKKNPHIIEKLLKNQRLPISELSKASGVELKTLERHRDYVIALMLAYTNGFEIIRGHLKEISASVNGGLK